MKLLVIEFKLTKRDKFIGVTWLLHKTYLEKMLRSTVCMHIKSDLSRESKGDEIGNRKITWTSEKSIKWNKFQVFQLSEAQVCSSKIHPDLVSVTGVFWHN
jgi:hypothetical protein